MDDDRLRSLFQSAADEPPRPSFSSDLIVRKGREAVWRARLSRTAVGLAAAGIVTAGAVTALEGTPPVDRDAPAAATGLRSIGVDLDNAGCGRRRPMELAGPAVGDHRPIGERIDYHTSVPGTAWGPPAFGPHWANYLEGSEVRKFYTVDDRPPLERLVHSLEHGWTLLWYDETIAKDEKQLDAVREIAGQFPSTKFRDKFMAVPWTAADRDGEPLPFGPTRQNAHLALTHWLGAPEHSGVWWYCARVSGEAVAQFMKRYPHTDAPEPNVP